jgi:hypothetical protein
MPYLRTLSVRFVDLSLAALLMSSVACGDDDSDTRDGGGPSTEDDANGANGGGTNGTGSSTAGDNGGSGNNGTSNATGGSNGGTNGEGCGGFAGTACPSGFFCNVEEEAGGAGCFTADGSGVCQSIPGNCLGIYEPVCSCNIRTYPSACHAHAASASVLHEGACTAEECESVGGRPVYSNGASTPKCESGEIGFEIVGREPSICCVKDS